MAGGEQATAREGSEFDEINQFVCCLVDEVVNTHSEAYSRVHWHLKSDAKHYNSIAWAVRSLPPHLSSFLHWTVPNMSGAHAPKRCWRLSVRTERM